MANISWQGHVGGFIAGAAIGAVLVFAPRGKRRAPVQLGGIAAIAVAVVLAIVTRIVTLS
jgi:membrane associated rhomboid family serine protease